MARLVVRAWQEVRRGENLDIYLTTTAAIVLAVLNLVGVAPTDKLIPVLLAVLGILAVSNLVNRDRLDRLLHVGLDQSGDRLLAERPTSYERDLRSARELMLVGVGLVRTVRTYYSEFERAATNGDDVHILLVDPRSEATRYTESRVYGRADVDRNRREIVGTLQDLAHLRSRGADRLKVRTIDHVPSFGATAVNASAADGVLYIEYYPYRTRDEARPVLALRPRDGYWYDFYKQQLELLWDAGTEWTPEQPASEVVNTGSSETQHHTVS
jgi:Domain of unknown function (DUF5919)